ncbi:GNAT family N-acetyltransferase [Salinisphaera sp. LB1]|uniref:GNAT family N-acetyltransferase n=1 Tax=Salinisphaera sp. LB1 TaxID=2183911 RepID=UPI000D706120|nr:GNAT family protein [Salinisphaera sp. LB1]AWN15856.1 Aminoglycoside N6'-acetyltransferase [Salinisphaera sp. LB1]
MTPTVDARFALRKPEPGDYAQLTRWISDAHAAQRWAGPNTPWPLDGPGLALALHREQARPHALVDATGSLIAFGEYYFKPPAIVRFARLIVNPARRGQRIIDTLILRLAAEADRHGAANTLELAVFADNAQAVRAYKRLGFGVCKGILGDDIMTLQRAAFH